MEIEREIFEPMPGFSREIGFYLNGIEEVRNQWREGIANLTTEELGKIAVPGAQTIGGLILHIAEAEYWWIQCVVKGKSREDAAKEVANWNIPEDFDFAAKGYDLAYCLAEIEKINRMTRESLAGFTDTDLENYYSRIRRGSTKEFTLRWILHHLIDHEATHKGQILMLKRLIREGKA